MACSRLSTAHCTTRAVPLGNSKGLNSPVWILIMAKPRESATNNSCVLYQLLYKWSLEWIIYTKNIPAVMRERSNQFHFPTCIHFKYMNILGFIRYIVWSSFIILLLPTIIRISEFKGITSNRRSQRITCVINRNSLVLRTRKEIATSITPIFRSYDWRWRSLDNIINNKCNLRIYCG